MTYHTEIENQLDRIESEDKGRDRKEILILGAGMAGLAAGYELASRGHQVKILEASHRPGGRVWTHHFDSGQYGELGAMRIPGTHDYTRYYTKEMNLTLREFVNSGDETYYDLEGLVCRAKDAPDKLVDLFNLSRKDRQTIQEEGTLDAVYLRVMAGVLQSLEKSDKDHLFDHGPLTDKLKYWDSQSLLHTFRMYADTPDAVRLMGKATVLDDYWQRSTLLFIREEIDDAFSGLEEIVDGMEELPKALADASLPDGTTLRERTDFCREVRAIEQTAEGLTVTFEHKHKDKTGELETVNAAYVLCTIPFSVLRRIDIKGLSGSKRIRDAIHGLGYQSATKVLVNCRERFWETEGIYGGASISDSIIKQTYYPSDNKGNQKSSVTEGPGVLLGSYTWGATARRLGVLCQTELGQLVVDRIERFHSQIKHYVDESQPYASMAWDQNPYAVGAFSSTYPHDLQMFFPGVSQPANRLFFAGEHLSPYPTWIQGALWSALQAVEQMVIA